MGFNKKHWLFHLLALVAVVGLAPANCGHKTADKNPSNTEAKESRLPHNVPDCRPTSSNNERKVDAGVARNDEAIDEDISNSMECKIADDCGCGNQCVDGQCRKFDFSCCEDTDCKIGDFCHKNSAGQNGMCLRAECDTDDQCDRCGTRCVNHLCVRVNCCGDADCPDGKVCADSGNYGVMWRTCITPECSSDTDCGCGKFCNEHYCNFYKSGDYTGAESKHCCGTDVYFDGSCYSHEHIENGRCLEDKHCPAGKMCAWKNCVPESCENNEDCGCEFVCRKGSCKFGCDNNSDCCDPNEVCDRSSCIYPNEEYEKYPD